MCISSFLHWCWILLTCHHVFSNSTSEKITFFFFFDECIYFYVKKHSEGERFFFFPNKWNTCKLIFFYEIQDCEKFLITVFIYYEFNFSVSLAYICFGVVLFTLLMIEGKLFLLLCLWSLSFIKRVQSILSNREPFSARKLLTSTVLNKKNHTAWVMFSLRPWELTVNMNKHITGYLDLLIL